MSGAEYHEAPSAETSAIEAKCRRGRRGRARSAPRTGKDDSWV